MLLREDGDAVVCIGQQAHAWVSGQIARNWALDPVEPREEVCLAAEQHDLGMAEWDAAPELNASTGLPFSFIEMPLVTHLRLWTAAPLKMLPQSRYAAVLVSMHGTALYETRDLSRMTEDQAAAVNGYLTEQRAFQAKLRAGLDHVERNQRLIWIWDFLSLGLCLRWHGRSIEGIELCGNTIDPWPFRDDAVVLRTEGRRLTGRYASRDEMLAALEGPGGAAEA